MLATILILAAQSPVEQPRFPDLLGEQGRRIEIPTDLPEVEIGRLEDSYLRGRVRLALVGPEGDPLPLSGVEGLGWTAEPQVLRPGGGDLGAMGYTISAGRPLPTPVILTRELSADMTLAGWAQAPQVLGGREPLSAWRRDRQIVRFDRRGRITQRWFLLGCIPSAYEAMSDTDQEAEDETPTESLTVQCSGVLRDTAL